MKKRIGLVTIHRALNVGAALQVYSTCKAVEALGHAIEIIDYHPQDAPSRRMGRTFSPGRLLSQVDSLLNYRQRQRQLRRFHQFQERLPIRPPTLHTVADVRRQRFDYDLYVCGSDQIWNPTLLTRGIGEPYYLEFVKDRRKVSYAPSFGVEEIPPGQRDRMAELINGIDRLSVRERSGVRIVEKLTGRKAEHLLDPTLLLDPIEFEEIAEDPSLDVPFLFVYPTQYPKKREQIEAMQEIARRLGLRIAIALSKAFHPRWLLERATFLWDVGPSQFLGLIRKASYVVTNSYHGTALSIALRKNLAVIPHAHYNTRMESLLSILDLGHRQLSPNAAARDLSIYLEPVDYTRVEPLLAEERKRSREFLRRAIED
ncbi:MAG: polysaccharide pyruvyl transferase family protein [Bradymonadales bacterium]|nr:polysaccharide pyruvyl transferase family protein [Bradymonadales bacterium]